MRILCKFYKSGLVLLCSSVLMQASCESISAQWKNEILPTLASEMLSAMVPLAVSALTGAFTQTTTQTGV